MNTTTNACQISVFRINRAITGVMDFLCNLFAQKTLIARLGYTVEVIKCSVFQLRTLVRRVKETRNVPILWHVQVESAYSMAHSKTMRCQITAWLAKVASLTKAPIHPQFAFLPLK